MPENEHYEPSEQETKIAAEHLNEDERQMSRSREMWNFRKAEYSGEAEKFQEFLNQDAGEREKQATERAKHEGTYPWVDETFRAVLGEGLPTNFIYHEFSGLSRIVAPQHMIFPPGVNVVDIEPTGKQEAAQGLLDSYEKHSSAVINSDPQLKALLEPIKPLEEMMIADKKNGLAKMKDPNAEPTKMEGESHFNDVLGDEEIERAVSALGKEKCEKLLESRTRGAYYNTIEPNFGRLFRESAMKSMTPEEFREYKEEVESALEQLRS